VKSDQVVGESVAELREVIESTQQMATDEVEQQRVNRQAQKAIRDYFNSVTSERTEGEKPAESAESSSEEEPKE